ncbi:MAG: nucleotidyltransferase domain-containing protein [Nanoarchaeota archaeon]
MKQTEILAYTYDFISMLLEQKNIKESLNKIILFGSIARGDFDEESDVDLFFEIKKESNEKETEQLIKETINNFEIVAEKTWNLRNINLPIKVIVGTENDVTWDNLKDEIKHYGLVLYGQYQEQKENKTLISYSLKNLNQNEKMNCLRKLYGYTTKTKNKVYSNKGFLSTLGAVKTATNQIISKIENTKEILALLKEFNVPCKVVKISV